jgi:hypothetical protein
MEEKTEISRVQILVLIGAGLLLLGCFTPIFTIKASALLASISRDLTLMSSLNSVPGATLIVYALAIIALTFKRYYRCVNYVAAFALIEVVYFFILFMFKISDITAKITTAASALLDISYGIGWLFLFIGPVLILLAPKVLPVTVSDTVINEDKNYEPFAYFIPVAVLIVTIYFTLS